jgi:hypothetical protein
MLVLTEVNKVYFMKLSLRLNETGGSNDNNNCCYSDNLLNSVLKEQVLKDTQAQTNAVKKPTFMEMDYDEIDRCLLPPNAFRRPRIAPISDVAPPQGNPFLDKVDSLYNLLKKESFIYR